MSLDKRFSPLLAKYLEQYQRNPLSRVFAALAESYRQLGMLEKAIDLLKDGINKHPHYPLGYLGLALCYAERDEHGLVYSTLRPIVSSNRDNIKLQKVFANACLQLENFDEALETYKYLLFINPKDRDVIARLEILQDKERVLKNSGIEKENPLSEGAPEIIPPTLFNLSELETDLEDGEGKAPENWVQVELHQTSRLQNSSAQPRIVAPAFDQLQSDFDEGMNDHWEIGTLKEKNLPSNLDQQSEVVEKLNTLDPDLETAEYSIPVDNGPVITLTLIDLYISQKHYAKALPALQQLLAANPNDQKVQMKLVHLQELMDKTPSAFDPFPANENSGLMAAYDQKIAAMGIERGKKVAAKLTLFLAKIKDRSDHFVRTHP